MYLSEIDRDDPPSQGKLKHALLAATNRCIEAYNMGEQNEAAPPGASLKDRFPSQKPAGERYKRLSGLHPLQIAWCSASCTARWASAWTSRTATRTSTSAFPAVRLQEGHL